MSFPPPRASQADLDDTLVSFLFPFKVSVAVQRVLDLLSEVERGTCEPKKVATQNSRTLGIIFMGVLKLILTEVEDARRLQTLPFAPRLACLIQFLSSGQL